MKHRMVITVQRRLIPRSITSPTAYRLVRLRHLLATLTGANASLPGDNGGSNSGSTTASSGKSGGIELAMIVLYGTTGVVSLLLCEGV
ncbi:hypothetical protein ACEPAH_6794 [Sanghuangporus vaninii]